MRETKLFVVYLDGQLVEGRVVLRKAKAKGRGHGRAHVDAVQQVDRVDGYPITTDRGYEPSGPA